MTKNTCVAFVLCALFSSNSFSCNREEGIFTKEAKPIYTAFSEKNWKKVLPLINDLQESPLKNYWLGMWYYSKENEMYNPQTSIELWETASKQGCFEAKLTLAGALFTAKDPRIANIGKSITLYKELLPDLEKKSQSGSSTALCNLGLMYMLGIVVQKDLKKSLALYERVSDIDDTVNNCKSNYEILQKLKGLGEL